MWNKCNCMVVWTFFGIAFLWDWNENWPFPVLWPLLSFPNLLACWALSQHHLLGKWPCVAANKSQKRKQNVKKEKAFLSVKGIYLGSPVLPFFSFLFKRFRPHPPTPVSLILHMFRHEVFSYFINGSLFSYQRRIFFFLYICLSTLCSPSFLHELPIPSSATVHP